MTDLRDFTPACKVNQGSLFPILPIRCHCGKRIGSKQRLIESEIGKNLELYQEEDISDSDKLSKARIKMLNDLGFVRTCCKLSLTMYSFLGFNDIEGKECNVDCTYLKEVNNTTENDYMGYNENKVPFEMFPLSNDNIGFDMDKYCIGIYSILTGKSKSDIERENSGIKNSEEKTYPKFPMLNAKRTHYPMTKSEIMSPEFM